MRCAADNHNFASARARWPAGVSTKTAISGIYYCIFWRASPMLDPYMRVAM